MPLLLRGSPLNCRFATGPLGCAAEWQPFHLRHHEANPLQSARSGLSLQRTCGKMLLLPWVAGRAVGPGTQLKLALHHISC